MNYKKLIFLLFFPLLFTHKIASYYKVYFAGDLFDQKHITGNCILAQYIEKLSNNTFKFILPQNWEGGMKKPIETRNSDIKAIIESDLVLFNFDGTDLDSGTVVEFMIAKMLDIPVVLLRTDCRNGGYSGEDWNFMALGYPRSVALKHPALIMYNDIGLQETHYSIAQSVIHAFEQVLQEKSLLHIREEIIAAYAHVIKLCGSDLETLITQERLHEVISSKIEKNIYF